MERNNYLDPSSDKLPRLCARKGNLKQKTESIKVKIDKMQQKSNCWLCGNREGNDL